MKDLIRNALVEFICSGELQIELPEGIVADGIRSNRPLLGEIVSHHLENGHFPQKRVHLMMEDRVHDWMELFQTSTDQALEKLRAYVESERILKIGIELPTGAYIPTGLQHKCFPELYQALQAKLNAYLVGPAGAGKTKGGMQAAKALGKEFFFTGAITSEYKLTGFIDAQGRVVCPAFRRAYEHGGLFLFDEIDASMPQAVLAFNAAISNDMMDFPDKMVQRHKDFYCMAAANTFGVGADRVYVGRNQMDGATIDRYAFIEWGYDEDLELAITLAQLPGAEKETRAWVKRVQKVRAQVGQLRIPHVVSPRASMSGALLLALGMGQEKVERMTLWKGMDATAIKRVVASIKDEALLQGEEDEDD